MIFLGSQQHRRIVARGAEPAAIHVIPEELVLALLKFSRPCEPLDVTTRLKQFQESGDQERIVLGVAFNRLVAATIPSQQDLSIGLPHRVSQEGRRRGGRLEMPLARIEIAGVAPQQMSPPNTGAPARQGGG